MIDSADTLLTIAEIAIAVVGFAGIAFVLRADSPTPLNLFRLQLMVETSVLAITFSFLPILLLSTGLGAERVWSLSSAILGVVSPVYVTTIFLRQAQRFGATLLPEARIADPTVLAATCVVTAIQVLNVFGWAFTHRFTGYLLGLLWVLASAVAMFVRIVLLSGASRAGRGSAGRDDDA